MPFHNLQEAEQKRKEIKICRTVTWTAGSKETGTWEKSIKSLKKIYPEF